MNIDEYTNLAMRTASPSAGDHGVSTDLVHAVMGIADEAWELLHAKTAHNVIEELGDLLWFCALVDESTEGDLFARYPDLDAEGSTPYDIATSALRLSGLIKKPYAYGKALPVGGIQAETLTVIAAVDAISSRLNITLAEVMELNLLKLKMRFPERFGCEEAIKRNVEHEAALFQHWEDVLPVIRKSCGWLLCKEQELEDARRFIGDKAARIASTETLQLDTTLGGYWIVYALPSPTTSKESA